ncbi:CobW family GTP-binding protein [Streptomyces anulatus]|uniref:CobW family GTP-binding protein n=1 Tax=Streptomyces anulatus TaxID=1892 RepID=UPI002E13B69C|nr:GTP-binding protein [Streptomyces anulatus]WTD13219.1 GTP-binding protein [Streptomyces anulatus]WTE06529.1 GTP-binding protein [Streptomyces anulatus]
MTPPRTPQIPVVVLAGFLGSGKTTLLNHLLRNRAGTRIGVIVNDFGAIEIDAMTVSGQVGSTVSLGNGCLCCAVDASELDTFLETLTRPSARLDVIVIEASGLAEPQELVRMLLASDNPHILYGGLVEVVDAAEFDRTRQRHPEIDRHLAVADLVVLNKTDRVGEAERERLRTAVAELSGPAAVISAVHGRIDPELLFDPALRPDHEEKVRQLTFEDLLREEAPDGHEGHEGHEGHDDHLHASYESVDFTSDVPMDPRRFMEFLDSRPDGLYRIKGFADFGAGDRDNTYALHAVGRFLRFVPRPWARGEQRLTQLVMIGAGIDAAALSTGLAACRADGAARADEPGRADAADVERAMWGVLRYVQEQAPEPEVFDTHGTADPREAAAEA